MSRIGGLVVAAACLALMPHAGQAESGAQFALEGGSFVQAFAKQVADYYDAQIEPLTTQRNELIQRRDNASTGTQWDELNSQVTQLNHQIDELGEKKRLAGGYEGGWRVFNAIKSIHETVGEIEEGMGQLDRWEQSIVSLDDMAAAQIAEYQNRIKRANELLDYAEKLKSFGKLLDDLDQKAPTPQIKRMITGLNMLLWSMKEFGDKVPNIGEFLKTYGDVGLALTQAAERLDRRLESRAGGLLIEGYRDDGRIQAFDRQFPDLAADRDTIRPFPGVRDAYYLPGEQRVMIWDPPNGRWWDVRDLTPLEVIRRYGFFATYGNPNPTVEQVLRNATDVIGVRLEPLDAIVAPGGTTLIEVRAERMDGETPIVHFALKAEQQMTLGSSLGFDTGNGRFSTSIADPEETVSWTAPNAENYVYRITASLAPGERGVVVGEPACDIGTGIQSVIWAEADPPGVEPGGDGSILFQIVDRNGAPLERKGQINIAGQGIEVEQGYWLNEAESRGAAPFHAPRQEGIYRVVVSFSGYMDAGFITGRNALAAETEVSVTVAALPQGETPVADTDTPVLPQTPTPPAGVERIEFEPLYLVHIIETSTMGGPVPKDEWILHPNQPDQNGVLLTADGTGGWFVNKTDQTLGPYTSNYEVCPVLAGMGVKGVWLGERWLNASREIWGGGAENR